MANLRGLGGEAGQFERIMSECKHNVIFLVIALVYIYKCLNPSLKTIIQYMLYAKSAFSSYIVGPAILTLSSTSFSYKWKAFWNIPASFLISFWKASLSAQAKLGLRSSRGTPSKAVGICRLKIAKCSNSALASSPECTASTMRRVNLRGQRLPLPNLPPVQPVLMSQQSTLCLAMRSASISA